MKFPKGLRLRLEFAALWLAVVIARAMPLQAASWLSGKLWRFVAPRLSRQKRALANLELAYPEKSPGERKAIAAAMWENLGRTFAESLCIKTLTKGDRIVFEPAEDFDEAARGAKPFIVCGLHLGNWEILAHGGQRLGVSLIGVYQRISNPHVEALMLNMREPLYKAGLTPKTPVTARVLLRAIKDGACPCFLADLRDDHGPSVPFFGGPRAQPSFPRSSPARRVCHFTPAPRSDVRARVSASASRPFQCRRQTTARRTPSRRRKRCSASTRRSSARRPNNGCGRTGSGTNRYRHHMLARPGPKESRRGGDHSSDSSRGFFSGRQSMIPAVLRLGGGSDTFCLVDNVL